MSEPIVEIQSATVCRSEQPILHDISLRIDQGCSTAILGPNGSGKSTLMKVFARELYPMGRSGTVVRLLGQEQWNVWDLRGHLGFISADLHYDYWRGAPGMEVVLSGFFSSVDLYHHQGVSVVQRARAGDVMDCLGLGHLRDKPFAQMSTGEQRRILLARALVHGPQILILDEPTTGLDVAACFQYLDILRQFMREGRTVILVTHHIHEIPPEIDRVVLLKNGRIHDEGSKADVLNSHSLSWLFDTSVDLLHRQGWFQVVPASTEL